MWARHRYGAVYLIWFCSTLNNPTSSEAIVFLNGKLVAAQDAQVSVFDRGFLFADGVYEVIPVYQGRLFEITAHLQRLANSLSAIKLSNPYTDTEWIEILKQLIVANGEGISTSICR